MLSSMVGVKLRLTVLIGCESEVGYPSSEYMFQVEVDIPEVDGDCLWSSYYGHYDNWVKFKSPAGKDKRYVLTTQSNISMANDSCNINMQALFLLLLSSILEAIHLVQVHTGKWLSA